jgi:putative membrane protein
MVLHCFELFRSVLGVLQLGVNPLNGIPDRIKRKMVLSSFQRIQKTMTTLNKYFPHILAVIYVIFWVLLAINPTSRDVWWAENIPLIAVFLFLVFTFKKFRFSNLAYFFMAWWLFWHTVGGYYTFANVPFDFFTDLFGFERNHFDRFGHLMIGFYAYPIAEFMTRKKLANMATSILFALFAIMALAAAYEIVEWIYAVVAGGEAGIEFLGSQGDVWDAQKDMLLDTSGAIFVLIVFWLGGINRNS